jgi:hypothetical protein
MRRFALALLFLAAAACGTGNAIDDSAAESTSDFAVQITQTNEPVLIAVDQPANFVYRIAVTNNTATPVTLKWIQLRTTGSGPYVFGPSSRRYDKAIAPGATETVDFWATGTITDYTRGGPSPPPSAQP